MCAIRDDKADEGDRWPGGKVGPRLDKSMAQSAIAWSLSRSVCATSGMNNKERMNEAVQTIKTKLTDEDIEYLKEPCLPKESQAF